MPLPSVWGPPFWTSLHHTAASFPLDPTENDRKWYITFFTSVGHILPCVSCRYHFKLLLRDHPVEDYLYSRQTLSYWVWMCHNKVNIRTGKKEMPYYIIASRYNVDHPSQHEMAIIQTNEKQRKEKNMRNITRISSNDPRFSYHAGGSGDAEKEKRKEEEEEKVVLGDGANNNHSKETKEEKDSEERKRLHIEWKRKTNKKKNTSFSGIEWILKSLEPSGVTSQDICDFNSYSLLKFRNYSKRPKRHVLLSNGIKNSIHHQ